MSRSKRVAAAALLVGALLGTGVLPASAAERGDGHGRHHARHYDDTRHDDWRQGRHCNRYDRDCYRHDGWGHGRGHHNGWHHGRGHHHGWHHGHHHHGR